MSEKEKEHRGKKKNVLAFRLPLGLEKFNEGKRFFFFRRILELRPLEMIESGISQIRDLRNL